MLGKHKEDLYHVNKNLDEFKENMGPVRAYACSTDLSCSDLWHYRSGHVPFG